MLSLTEFNVEYISRIMVIIIAIRINNNNNNEDNRY